MSSVYAGNDTLALMPTGGGKSICFQVPAMAKEGLCLVITPLIALMKDQVENLRKRDIKAYAIYTGITRDQVRVMLDNCQFGNYKFLYVSPERLENEAFRKRLSLLPVNLIAVDEAHCISQWGYDFRPPYLRIAQIRKDLPDVPVLALTATATPEVMKDIQDKLSLPTMPDQTPRKWNVFGKVSHATTYRISCVIPTTNRLNSCVSCRWYKAVPSFIPATENARRNCPIGYKNKAYLLPVTMPDSAAMRKTRHNDNGQTIPLPPSKG